VEGDVVLDHLDDFAEDGADDVDVGWLGQHLVHLVPPRLQNVLLLSVTGARHDFRLQDLVGAVVSPNVVCGLETIHQRHGTVHEDQAVGVRQLLVRFPHQLQRLLPIQGLIDEFVESRNLGLLDQNLQSKQIVRFVIDDHDSAIGDQVLLFQK